MLNDILIEALLESKINYSLMKIKLISDENQFNFHQSSFFASFQNETFYKDKNAST